MRKELFALHVISDGVEQLQEFEQAIGLVVATIRESFDLGPQHGEPYLLLIEVPRGTGTILPDII